MGKLLIYCYSITFFEIIVIVSAIKKIVIATWSANSLEPEPKDIILIEPIRTGTECCCQIQNRNRRILESTKH